MSPLPPDHGIAYALAEVPGLGAGAVPAAESAGFTLALGLALVSAIAELLETADAEVMVEGAARATSTTKPEAASAIENVAVASETSVLRASERGEAYTAP